MKSLAVLATALLLPLVAACSNVPGADGRYATPARGGWDNFRAGLPDPTNLGQGLEEDRGVVEAALHGVGRPLRQLPIGHGEARQAVEP